MNWAWWQAHNSSTWEAEAGGSQVRGQTELYSELCLKQTNNNGMCISLTLCTLKGFL